VFTLEIKVLATKTSEISTDIGITYNTWVGGSAVALWKSDVKIKIHTNKGKGSHSWPSTDLLCGV
jgi:hypothetical protein